MNNSSTPTSVTSTATNQKPVVHYHSNTVHAVPQEQKIAQTVPNVAEVSFLKSHLDKNNYFK